MTGGDVRVGIDLASAADVRESLARFGERYLRRLFTEQEIETCGGAEQGEARCERLAARFAAKEATLKVLRVEGVQPPWTSMEVFRHAAGHCELRLSGSASTAAEAQGLRQPLSVSLTHHGGLAAAVVVAVVC